jgi:3,4-dihydroxy 2-butanone 4-phosphate synthase/GTP cyclohydrolase II
MQFGTVEQAIADIKAGKLIIVADDEDRENEGDLICAAELVTPEMINFMIRKAGGWICLALTGERADKLELAQQTEDNTDEYRTAFTISIDAHERFGVTTGVSAQDRAKTIRVAVDPQTVPMDLRRPGHVPPLRARQGGVLQRVGHTEAAVDLARLAGLTPAGVVCEILSEDGSSARRPELERFAQEHGLTFITVAQLVAHRLQTERLVHRVAEARLPTEVGTWRVVGYRNDVDNHEHIALVYGDVGPDSSVLVRMHSKCLTGDVFHSLRCDCGWQLEAAEIHPSLLEWVELVDRIVRADYADHADAGKVTRRCREESRGSAQNIVGPSERSLDRVERDRSNDENRHWCYASLRIVSVLMVTSATTAATTSSPGS